MDRFEVLLSGGDRRSIGQSDQVARMINGPEACGELLELTDHPDRLIAMRAYDAVEKVAQRHPEWIRPHKRKLLAPAKPDMPIEVKWHLARLWPMIDLSPAERARVVAQLWTWADDPRESRIVRADAIAALARLDPSALLPSVIARWQAERIPSLQARLRKLGLIPKHPRP